MARGIKRKFDELQHSDEEPLSLNDRAFHDPLTSEYVYPKLSNRELVNLSETCKAFRAWTLEERTKRAKSATSASVLAVVQGNEAEAKRLLEINPGLLRSAIGIATDYSNRCIEGLTPFQAALCAGDVEMCDMMKVYFVGEKGQAELEKQFNAVFPDGLEAHIQTQQENVFDFNEILQAIIRAPAVDVTAALNKQFNNDLPLHKALDKFREEFKKKSLSEIVFNPYHLLQAFQTYDDKFDDLRGDLWDDNWDKLYLFWRQVTGFVQRYFPACYLQAFAQGIYPIVEKNEKLLRAFEFKEEEQEEEEPIFRCFPDSSTSGLGYDWSAGRAGGFPQWVADIGASGSWRQGVPAYRNYVEQKHQALKNYAAHCSAREFGKVCNSLK